MKHPLLRDDSTRFSGRLRHYHRSGTHNQRSWEEWVEGGTVKRVSRAWLKGAGILIAVLTLGGIIAGLVIELL